MHNSTVKWELHIQVNSFDSRRQFAIVFNENHYFEKKNFVEEFLAISFVYFKWISPIILSRFNSRLKRRVYGNQLGYHLVDLIIDITIKMCWEADILNKNFVEEIINHISIYSFVWTWILSIDFAAHKSVDQFNCTTSGDWFLISTSNWIQYYLFKKITLFKTYCSLTECIVKLNKKNFFKT